MTHKREHFHITKLKRTYNRSANTFTFNISYETAPAKRTQRTLEVAEAFGLGTDQTQRFTLYDNTEIHVHPTDIVLITGDSGSGKSALLKAIKADLGTEAQDTWELSVNGSEPVIDTVGENTHEALELLSKVGLNDAFLFLRSYSELSDGQKHCYHIARLAETNAQWWLLDEFTSTLDRDTARIVAFSLQRIAVSKPSAAVTDALAGLERLGFDVALLPCAGYVEKRISLVGCGKIAGLLETLSLQDAAVRKRLANLQSIYPKHEEFALKLRGLDTASLAQVLKRLSFLAQKKVYLFWKKPED